MGKSSTSYSTHISEPSTIIFRETQKYYPDIRLILELQTWPRQTFTYEDHLPRDNIIWTVNIPIKFLTQTKIQESCLNNRKYNTTEFNFFMYTWHAIMYELHSRERFSVSLSSFLVFNELEAAWFFPALSAMNSV